MSIKACQQKANIPLVGCASHSFNLGMNNILSAHTNIINKVHNLMKKVSNLIQAATLRRLTPMCAISKNDTMWSPVYDMIERYDQIKRLIRMIKLAEVL